MCDITRNIRAEKALIEYIREISLFGDWNKFESFSK